MKCDIGLLDERWKMGHKSCYNGDDEKASESLGH